ncbi:hypothetical protein JHK82_052928 [Glycine max]|nr:hypothetical protein JHK86_052777 [Glycine max]KAG5082769.1 hypothetical protein JHK84_052807 [Glycine max]KAG5085531.1 hypothetical protein JHK82_052928 [Glycine max]
MGHAYSWTTLQTNSKKDVKVVSIKSGKPYAKLKKTTPPPPKKEEGRYNPKMSPKIPREKWRKWSQYSSDSENWTSWSEGLNWKSGSMARQSCFQIN